MYLLDADILKAGDMGNPQVVARLQMEPQSRLFISIVTLAEVLQGWLAQINKKQGSGKNDICSAYDNLAQAHHNLRSFNIVRYSLQAEAVFQDFPSSVKRVGTNDCRIAATAIAHGLIVVTRNTRDFEKIPHVKFEDWTLP